MNLLQWIAVTSRLASLTRFSMERLAGRESVLEHVGQVALTALALAHEVNGRALHYERDEAVVDVGTVLARALCHDIDEVITGDIARPTKYATPEATVLFKALSTRSIAILKEDLGESMRYFPSHMAIHHERAKDGREGAIVALADILAVVAKVWEETILRGNGAMIRQAHTATSQLEVFRARIDREFADGAAGFLHDVVTSAIDLMAEAKRRDSEFFATRVEVYGR